MRRIALLLILILPAITAYANSSTDCYTDMSGNIHCDTRSRSTGVQVIQGTPRRSTAGGAVEALQSFANGYQQGQAQRRERELHEMQMRILQQQLMQQQQATNNNQLVEPQAQAIDLSKLNATSSASAFSIGDHKSKVVAALGQPSSVYEGLRTWYYWPSYVQFDENDMVKEISNKGNL